MQFREVAEYFEKIEKVSSRLEMTDLLGNLLSKAPKSDIANVIYLSQGKLGPDFLSLEPGMGEKLVIEAIAKFSGYDTACAWKSIIFPVALGEMKGVIDRITVLTPVLVGDARCDLTIESNQAIDTSSVFQITTAGKTKHFTQGGALGIGNIEDFRVALDWSEGDGTNACPIRKIRIDGHFTEA